MRDKRLKLLIQIVTIISTILIVLFVLYGIKLGIFNNKTILIDFMKKFGIFAPIIFILIQIFQVVFPVIPGGASCLAGVLAFGSIPGFIYNYIGISSGSLVAFYLSKKYGMPLLKKLFKQESLDKYLKYVKNNIFTKMFFIGIFFPGFPDDMLCYIAGVSNMTYKKFIYIILVAKPLSLLMYSIFYQVM